MGQHGQGDRGHVVGQDEHPAGQERPRLAGAIEGDAGPRARPEAQVGVHPRGPDQTHDVAADVLAHGDDAGGCLEQAELVGPDHRRHPLDRVRSLLVEGRDPQLGLLGRVADPDLDEEAIELRLRQGERPLELDRVLRRQDEERVRQPVGLPVDGNLVLLHRFEQRRLRPRRRPVHLVDEQDVGEDRAGHEPEGADLVDRAPGDVARQEVRGPLDAGERQPERSGERARERRLAGAGHVFDQGMAVGKEGHGEQPERVLAADDRRGDSPAKLVPEPLAARRGRERRMFHVGHHGVPSAGSPPRKSAASSAARRSSSVSRCRRS